VLPSRTKVATVRLQIPTLWLAAGLTFAGFAMTLQHNNLGSRIEVWAWYYAFPLAGLPVGISLAIAYLGQYRPGRAANRFVVYAMFAMAAMAAAIDVSRKDTGATLLPLIACVGFGFRPQRPFFRLTLRRSLGLALAGLALGAVLMATRSYSWSVQRNTVLNEELLESYKSRRANDVIGELAFVVDTTPSKYPFLNGRTLGSIVPIPRVLWKNRPPAHSYYVGLERRGMFGFDFNPNMMGENQLSVSAHLLGEGYANFGDAGALVFELAYGGLIGVYTRILNSGRSTTIRILHPTILFFTLTQQRGDLAMMNSGWLMSAGMLYGLLAVARLVRMKSRKTISRGVSLQEPYPLTHTS
jgi:hypothetical protein